jgi:hypothetical protein
VQYDRRCEAQHDPKEDERKQRTCSATRIGRMLQSLNDGGKWGVSRGCRQDFDASYGFDKMVLSPASTSSRSPKLHYRTLSQH